MKKFRDYVIYLLVQFYGTVIAFIPRTWYMGIGRFWAPLISLFPVGKVATQNVQAAFPEKSKKEVRRIVRESLAHMIAVSCEFFWIRKRNADLPSLVDIEEQTLENFERCRKAGKPVIFISPHHGNWEFGGQMLSLGLGFTISTIMRSPQNPYLGKLLVSGRSVKGVEIIFSKGAARAVMKAVKDGRSIGILMDQNTRVRDGGIFVDFFGLKVPVTSLPARIALKDKLPIVLGTEYRTGKRFGMTTVYIEPQDDDTEESLTQRMISAVEDIVRKWPEQYLWAYRRFQHIPPGEDRSRYPAYSEYAKPSFFDQRERGKNKKQQEETASA